MYKCILLAFCLITGLSSHAAAQGPRDCGFGFDIDTQSSAFQSMVVDGEKKRGFWLSISRAPADVRALAKHIGRLQVCLMTPDGKPRSIQRGGRTIELKSPFLANCTAALLPNNRLLTNAHCFYNSELEQAGFTIVREARIDFNYTSKDDIGVVRTYLVSPRELNVDRDLDALVLQVLGGDANSDLGGHIPMKMMSVIEPLQALGMIHHPGSDPQQYSSGTCQVHRRQAEIPEARSPFRHTCESMGGSSGSLLFDARTLALVALHNQGGLKPKGDSFNGGHKIGMIEAALNLGFEEYTQEQDPSDAARQALTDALLIFDPKAKAQSLRKLKADFPNTPEARNATLALEQIIGAGDDALVQATGKISDSTDTIDRPIPVAVDACDDVYEEVKQLSSCFAYRAYVKQCGEHRLAALGHGYIEENCQQVAKGSERDDSDIPNSRGRPWCENASLSLTEVTICNNQELTLLDEELAEVYGDVESAISDQEQMSWLLQQRNYCGDNVGCLAGKYRGRILALKNYRFGLQFARGLNRPGYCHLVVGARRTLAEANQLVNSYPLFKNAQIFRSRNNWYAFSVGQVTNERSSTVMGQLVERSMIPSDSYCSKGELFRARYSLGSNQEVSQISSYVLAPQDEWLNIRTGPGPQFDVLGRVGNGQQGTPIQSQGSWSEFNWGNGLIGWAHHKFISEDPVRKHSCTGRVVGLSPIEQYNKSTGAGFLSIRSSPTAKQGHRLSELYLGDEVLVFEETQGWAAVVCMSGNCLNPNRGNSASRGWTSKKYLDITCS